MFFFTVQEFDVQRITIQFGKAYPPGKIILYKSTTGFAAYQMKDFAYLVKSTAACLDTPAKQVTNTPASLAASICSVYSIDVLENPEAADDFLVDKMF